MNKTTRKALVIGLIAGILVLVDGLITKILGQTGSFTWVAFVSWTVFFGETIQGRFKAIFRIYIRLFCSSCNNEIRKFI